MRVKPKAEQNFRPIDVADTAHNILPHQQQPDRRARCVQLRKRPLRIGIVAQRVLAKPRHKRRLLRPIQQHTRRRPAQVRDMARGRQPQPHRPARLRRKRRVGRRLARAPANPANARPGKTPHAIQAKMHPQPKAPGKPQEHLLPMRLRHRQRPPIQHRRPVRETTLRAGSIRPVADKMRAEDSRKTMDGVAFRHGASQQ